MKFSNLDWWVLIVTLVLIILYGLYKSRTSRNLEGYFLGDRQMPWYMVMLGVMGTQASAVTFLTAPGQAYTDGLRFIQYYFGLPLAMVILCVTLVPLFHRLKVFTAYQYLEQRFDRKTRTLTSTLFLLSRGLSTGISLVAPSIVLHSLLGWDFYLTTVAMGGLLIIYTSAGGAKAVAYTQQLQFLVIYGALLMAGYYVLKNIPAGLGLKEVLHLSGKSGKLNIITSGIEQGSFNWKDRYNVLSGCIGGLFLALSYFGTDQSQVGRYLTARNLTQSRFGLLMNGLVKVPLQFFILFIGVMVFVLYQFHRAPAYFNLEQEKVVQASPYAEDYTRYKLQLDRLQDEKAKTAEQLVQSIKVGNSPLRRELESAFQQQLTKVAEVRDQIRQVVKKANPGSDGKDTNYIFLRFVGDFLPSGLVGLIIAMIFLASWGSLGATLNSLASCTMIDFHQPYSSKKLSAEQEYRWSKFYTLLWGIFCIWSALFAYNLGNSLIEAVNILGSWFYGTILGIFLVAFYLKRVGGNAVFAAALLAEALVVVLYYADVISFLWLNVIGALAVMLLAVLFQQILGMKKTRSGTGFM
jgi:Na+/proline symporter